MRNEEKRMETRTARLYELDLLKALAIVSMVLCHCVIRLGLHQPDYEQDLRYLIVDTVFGDYLAVAHAFMFAMGVAVNYSRKNSPGALLRRGVGLYVSASSSISSATGSTRWPTGFFRARSWRRPSMRSSCRTFSTLRAWR